MKKEISREPFACPPAEARDPFNPLPSAAPAPAGALVTQPPPGASTALAETGETSLTPHIDAHGFDPAEYKWVPVRRRRRADGWSEAKQRAFIEVLADSGTVELAAQHVGMSVQSCYRLRRAPGAEAFAAAWTAATQQAALKLVDIAFDRALHGSDEPVFDRDGRRVGRRMKPSDRLLMFLLRAHLPERYRHADRDARQPGESAPPETMPLAQAIATLEPAMPPEPHRLMPPEELDVELEVADIANGELPHWYRDDAAESDMSLGEAFEAQLEAIKDEAARERGYVRQGDDEDA